MFYDSWTFLKNRLDSASSSWKKNYHWMILAPRLVVRQVSTVSTVNIVFKIPNVWKQALWTFGQVPHPLCIDTMLVLSICSLTLSIPRLACRSYGATFVGPTSKFQPTSFFNSCPKIIYNYLIYVQFFARTFFKNVLTTHVFINLYISIAF